MKTIILILTISILFGCEQQSFHNEVVGKHMDFKIRGRTFEIYEIDSCEYIGSSIDYHGAILTHKGNCKFCKIRTHE